ncbi:MAG TPA: hypothetical protein DFL85_01290 [Lentisphaeria bacterium]|uniref:hypothetical protein n=1 Tax=Victivallis lenta TaxID=2606640 RepID=UPI000E976FCF|nr:hypothetical protein [Victivallis lenta]HBP08257.1 hypothetical protein [Lentisphaeria bacterium]HCH84128.1 hypothetical protein [Lentisphaeria bacterium]
MIVLSAETVRPVRRAPEGEAPVWHALRLDSPETAAEWSVCSVFLPEESPHTVQKLLRAAGC